MRLPPEIINLVLESLSNEPQGPNIDALKACNLTSSTFSEMCEPYLYSCIYIYRDGAGRCEQPDPYDLQCRISVDRLSKTLAVKPHVSRHVKRLGLLILVDAENDVWRPLSDWFRNVDKVVTQLPLHQIEWFKFYSNRICSIADVVVERTLLLRIISSPALKTLHLYGVMNFPLCDAVSPRHNIRHMDIGISTLFERTTDDWDDKIFTLDSLVIRPTANAISRLLGFKNRNGADVVNLASMSRLRILDSSFGAGYLRIMIIERCFKLEELELSYTYDDVHLRFMWAPPTEKTTNPIWGALVTVEKTLRNLELRLDRWPSSPYTTCRDDLENLFLLPPDMCFASLTHIHLHLRIRGPENLPNNGNEDRNLDGVVDYICNQKAFPSLQRVQISLKYGEHQGGYGIPFKGWTLTQ